MPPSSRLLICSLTTVVIWWRWSGSFICCHHTRSLHLIVLLLSLGLLIWLTLWRMIDGYTATKTHILRLHTSNIVTDTSCTKVNSRPPVLRLICHILLRHPQDLGELGREGVQKGAKHLQQNLLAPCTLPSKTRPRSIFGPAPEELLRHKSRSILPRMSIATTLVGAVVLAAAAGLPLFVPISYLMFLVVAIAVVLLAMARRASDQDPIAKTSQNSFCLSRPSRKNLFFFF